MSLFGSERVKGDSSITAVMEGAQSEDWGSSSSLFSLFINWNHKITKKFNFLSTRDKIAEFANSVELYEVAQYEPPHLDLHWLPSGHWILNLI